MIEKKIAKGGFFTFPHTVPMPGPVFRQNTGSFYEQPACNLQWDDQVKNGDDKTISRTVSPGISGNVSRNFQFLGYYPYVITHLPTNGFDVLSGHFTGCWMILARFGGAEHVFHVGTEYDHEKNKITKEKWNKWAQSHNADIIAGFQPNRHWLSETPILVGKEAINHVKIYGLITQNHQLFTIAAIKQIDTPNLYRIAGIQLIASAPKSHLCFLPLHRERVIHVINT